MKVHKMQLERNMAMWTENGIVHTSPKMDTHPNKLSIPGPFKNFSFESLGCAVVYRESVALGLDFFFIKEVLAASRND